MTPCKLLPLCLLLVLGAWVAPPSATAASAKKVRVIVEFESSPGKKQLRQVSRAGGRIDHRYKIVDAVAARVPETSIRRLRRNGHVASVERDGRARALDYRSTHDWGIAHLKAELVHGLNTGTGANVAVLDTGIDCVHQELDSNCTLGPNYVDGVSSSRDDNGHGTHVAGAVAAERNEGVSSGVVGMAPSAGVVAYKVLDSGGYGYWSDIAAAIDHVWRNDTAHVINMSLGGSSAPSVLEDAANNAYADGILLVAAAGNGGNCGGNNDSVSVPADYDSVVAVAAVDQSNSRPCWSATGPQVELSAPGVSTFSTWPHDKATSASNPQPVCEAAICHYKYGSGTSMASPHAAGAAALVLASGTLSDTSGANGLADEVRRRLQETAIDLGPAGRDGRYGYGLIDALAATSGDSGTPTNSPPTAQFTYVCTGLSCSFDGSGSSDSDGTVASYEWDFGDGTTGGGATVSHEYSAGGSYLVTLTVTDDDDATDTETAEVTVSSGDTGATLGIDSISPSQVPAGTTTSVTAGGSGFVSGTTVSFANGRGPNPTAVVTGVTSDTLTADVTVKSSGPSGDSAFDVVVQNPDGASAVLPGGLTVIR